MTAGYDRRRDMGKPIRSELTRIYPTTGPGPKSTGHSLWKEEVVVSHRDNPTGEIVPDYQADPYAWMISSRTAAKRKVIEANGSHTYVAVRGGDPSSVIDNGHPLSVVKQRFVTSHNRTNYTHRETSTRVAVGGPVVAKNATINSLAALRMPFEMRNDGTSLNRRTFLIERLPAPSTNDLVSYGADAIGRVAPSSDGVNVFAMTGELIIGFPKVIGASLLKVDAKLWKTGGDEFLNFVFGVTPTIRDIADLVKVLTNLSQRIIQIRVNSGRGIRRSWQYPVRERTETFQSTDLENQGRITLGHRTNAFAPVGGSDTGSVCAYSAVTSELHMHDRVSDRFTGSFTYYIPETKNLEMYIQYAERLFGKLDMSAAWQLTPWSWLIDWIYDVGSLLRTVEVVQNDNLVINYGYITRHLTREVMQSSIYTNPSSTTWANYGMVHSIASLKQLVRLRANPYGFVSPISTPFTGMQLAILVALGFSQNGRYQ